MTHPSRSLHFHWMNKTSTEPAPGAWLPVCYAPLLLAMEAWELRVLADVLSSSDGLCYGAIGCGVLFLSLDGSKTILEDPKTSTAILLFRRVVPNTIFVAVRDAGSMLFSVRASRGFRTRTTGGSTFAFCCPYVARKCQV